MILALSVVTACTNDSNDNVKNPIVEDLADNTNNQENDTTTDPENESIENDNDQTAMQEKMDKLDFQEFELEVDYPDDIEYEAEIEKKSTGLIEAELEDEAANIKLKGLQAFDEIYPLVEKLDITKDSSKEDVINKVITAFDLAEDYTKIEVEITFNDGTKMEQEVKR